jgi:hypothetical protein
MTLVNMNNGYSPHCIYHGKENHLISVGAEAILVHELPPTATWHSNPYWSFLHFEFIYFSIRQVLYKSSILYNIIERNPWIARDNIYKYKNVAKLCYYNIYIYRVRLFCNWLQNNILYMCYTIRPDAAENSPNKLPARQKKSHFVPLHPPQPHPEFPTPASPALIAPATAAVVSPTETSAVATLETAATPPFPLRAETHQIPPLPPSCSPAGSRSSFLRAGWRPRRPGARLLPLAL